MIYYVMGTVLIFGVLLTAMLLSGRVHKQQMKETTDRVDTAVQVAAEVAQKRHIQKFGKEDTQVNKILDPEGSNKIKDPDHSSE